MTVIPIGREDAGLHGQSWVTYALMALNVIAFLLFCAGSSARDEGKVIRDWRETIVYLHDRPYLSVPPQVADLMPAQLRQRKPAEDPAVPDYRIAKEEDELRDMANELRHEYDALPDVRNAYVPAIGWSPAIVTSMFLHAGWLHLIGNMLFLFATAPILEDLLGSVLFSLLYLSGGIVATVAYGLRYPDSVIPLVGASGAISAVLGAYLVCFATSRLRFLLIPLMIRFTLPAIVVLPFWFLAQLVASPAEEGSGVAVTAHIGGFTYGLIFAWIVRVARRAPAPRGAKAARKTA
ncbi:MAG TPA: rhomboid family intramembrane serine protease, partial [Thermoanaerobaculia bacterium]|nr:rhomboid family intramembrane serine protease [Thermoanaerobaculia bacterium]